MDDAQRWFLEAARSWCQVMHQAPTQPLAARVEQLSLALTALYHAGLHLQAEGEAPDLPLPPPLPHLELGAYAVYLAVVDHRVEELELQGDLATVTRSVAAGLECFERGEVQEALAWWVQGFEGEWGLIALRCLAPLHQATAAFRADRRPRARKGLHVAEIVELKPQAPEVPAAPFLGIQLQPVPGGAEIVAVHPEGPAAGRLHPGDCLIAVDGEPVGGLDLDGIRDLLLADLAEHTLEIYRQDTTMTVRLAPALKAPTGAAPPHDAPARPAPGRQVTVRVLHPEGAQRASMALRILGCTLKAEDGRLHIRAPATLEDDDLRALLDAGAQAGVWAPA